MRRPDWRVGALLVGLGLTGLAWLTAGAALLWAVTDTQDRDRLLEVLVPQAGLLILASGMFLLMLAPAVRWLVTHHVQAPARMAEEAASRLTSDGSSHVSLRGNSGARALARAFNRLLEEHRALRQEMETRIRESSRAVEREKRQLAALMSELTKSVVVCNLEGRILLYNNRARRQFRRLVENPEFSDGAELMGLGRSILTVIDRRLINHALESVRRRLARDPQSSSARFVTTTAAGRLLRVHMTPVLAGPDETETDAPEAPEITGYVLLIENITQEYEADAETDRQLQALTEGSRQAVANTRAAIEVLEDPDIDEPLRARLLGVIREEVAGMSLRIESLHDSPVGHLSSRWPLEEMRGADLVEAAIQNLEERLGLEAESESIDESLWLKVESFSLVELVVHLAWRAVHETDARHLGLCLTRSGNRACLDLLYSGAGDDRILADWLDRPLNVGDDSPLGLTPRTVLDRHDGDGWIDRVEDGNRIRIRLLLPLAEPREVSTDEPARPLGSRPEYYDFDLFGDSKAVRSLEDTPLARLNCTVFDTETTGLDPAGGDEIVQLGAVRIVNGRVLAQERFDQLVRPRQTIPARSTAIHGITPEMVREAPTIEKVLPAFHAFCADTVLVAHNAAFDMRCLEIVQGRVGLEFNHPVLDTLLLSALVHPQQESHDLESIAERFGLTVQARHTALGDARVTAEIFLRLIRLLGDRGIETLGQARDASRTTLHARIKY